MNPVLETLKSTGTPADVVTTLETFEAKHERLRAQKFRNDKERSEFSALAENTAQSLVGQLGREILASEAERDRELRALNEDIDAPARIPSRSSEQTDSEHVAALLRRQIRESQRVAALTLAAADVQTVVSSSDPDMILGIVDDALTSAPGEAVRRIGRAAEVRLQVLAAQETRDGALPGPAFAAHLAVQDRMRHWRGTQPEARREQILGRHSTRVANARTNIEAGARIFGLETFFRAAQRQAALSPK